jgi:hypothetical protein
MEDVTTAHCQYQRLNNGIHQFEIMNASRQGVDDFFRLRAQLQDDATEEIVLLLIHLNMPQLPSITHIMTHVRQFAQKYPRIQPTYSAIIYRRGMLVFVLNNFLKVFLRSKDRVMFFAEDEAEKAAVWLMGRD